MRKSRSAYFAHELTFKGKTENVQCLGANCPLCGMWQEQKEKTERKMPKTPNLVDKPIVGLGKQLSRMYN